MLLQEGVSYDQCILLAKLSLAFAVLHFVLQGQTCLLLQISPDFLLLHSSPLCRRGYLFLVLVLEGPIDLQNRSTSASLALVVGAQTWNTVILNGLPWKRTEIILSFLRLHPSTTSQTLVDHEGYSISSKGFLPTVVDKMVT